MLDVNLNTPNPILEAWRRTLDRRGGAPAILAADGTVLRTFAQIEEGAVRLAAKKSVTASGGPGFPCALQLGNNAELPSFLLALWRLGRVPVLLDQSLDGPNREAALDTCRASALVTWEDPQDSRRIFHVQLRNGAPFADGTQFLKLTSGTTGVPRAIRFTAAQLLADCDAVCDTMGLTEAELNYGVIPWSHSYGFSNLVTPLLCRGIPVVATEDRLPRAILDGLARSGATVFPGLPVFFQKLAELDSAPLPRLRLCISAGAPLAASVASAFRARFGIKVHSFYGSSECGGIAYDAADHDVPEGCVGQPMRGVSLDFEDTAEEPTRLSIRSAAVGEAYFPEPDAAVLSGGRFTPGDLVRRTPDGLVLAGRVSDFINVAGRKLNPATVEAVLRACPGVSDAVVFGLPHPLRGEEPVACVAGTASAELLQSHCANTLPAWQLPRAFWIVPLLPVNERGKLNRRALAEAYAAHSGKCGG
jgi:long-chain acyl-CoA synthetase